MLGKDLITYLLSTRAHTARTHPPTRPLPHTHTHVYTYTPNPNPPPQHTHTHTRAHTYTHTHTRTHTHTHTHINSYTQLCQFVWNSNSKKKFAKVKSLGRVSRNQRLDHLDPAPQWSSYRLDESRSSSTCCCGEKLQLLQSVVLC